MTDPKVIARMIFWREAGTRPNRSVPAQPRAMPTTFPANLDPRAKSAARIAMVEAWRPRCHAPAGRADRDLAIRYRMRWEERAGCPGPTPPDSMAGDDAAQPRRAARSGLPILGPLSTLAKVSLLVTLAVSVAAIVLDFVLHVDKTILFVTSAGGDPGAGVGRRPLDRAARLADRTAGRRHPERDVRQHRRADHRVLRAARGPHRGGQGVTDGLDHRQPAAGPRRQRAARRLPSRDPGVQREARRRRMRHCSSWPSSACSCRRSSPSPRAT